MQGHGANQVRVVFGRCGNEQVTSINLSKDLSDKMLWRIDDATGSSRKHFTVGEEPNGFRTTMHLRPRLPPSEYLTLQVWTDNRQFPVTSVTFRLDELQAGLFHSDTGPELSPSDLENPIRDGCVVETAHPL